MDENVDNDASYIKEYVKNKDSYYYDGGKLLANPPPGEEIVISGMSGAFPNSSNIQEFKENLFNKVNMVLSNKRWNFYHPEIPDRCGTIPEIDKYDSGFFGVHERQSHSMDIMARILQEKVVEAIFDAGLHPSDLEGTKTGVYVGVCFSENHRFWFYEKLDPQSFAITGSEQSMIAHRISYFLKLRGPSYTLDTACSSASFGLENAYRAIRSGEIDNAIVAGTNLCLHPFTTMQFLRLGVLNKDGRCKSFDIQGDGYVRSEAFAVLILQKSKIAKRIYATVLHVKLNGDGYKEYGISFPSKKDQQELMTDFYEECNVDRFSISFMEAHGTGTKVGDPEECAAIDSVLAERRTTPLLIGSVKSNIGHTEPTSGLCSIIKCIIAMETGYIPPNIHFNKPKPEIRGIVEGRLKVVVDKTPLEGDNILMGVNNFGIGGTNSHMLIRWNPEKKDKLKNELPRLVCVSGRTEEAINVLLNEVAKNIDNVEYLRLLHDVFRRNIQNHLLRGYVLASNNEIKRSLGLFVGFEKPLHLAFGKLDNWYNIGKNLMKLPAFSNNIRKIQTNLLTTKDINIENILNSKSYDADSIPVIGCVAVQISIFEILELLGIKSKRCFGYSFGAVTSAYCNGYLSLDETINCAFIINETLRDSKHVHKSSTLKGDKFGVANYDINRITNGNGETLNRSLQIPKIREFLIPKLTKTLTRDSIGSVHDKITTIDNLIESLRQDGYRSTDSIAPNSIILEMDSKLYFEVDDVTTIHLFGNKNEDYLADFLEGVGSLYIHGHNPQISIIYPQIDFPVSRGTPMISPYIRWKHTREKFIPHYDFDIISQNKKKTKFYTIELVDSQWAFLTGHVIDGRNLFPATAYVYLVWECFLLLNGWPLETSRVCLENCKFIRATRIPAKDSISFAVSIQTGSGNFEVIEGNSIVMTGTIKVLPDVEAQITQVESREPAMMEDLGMNKRDVYKELRLRGYDYSGEFQAIENCNFDVTKGFVKWGENWIAFMDNMLQLTILQADTRLLYVPTFIARITIAADTHLELIKQAFKSTTSVLPVFNDRLSGEIKCGGITISGLIPSSISRKRDKGIPVLERYEFISNSTELDVQSSVRVNIQIVLENALVYKVKTVEVIDDFADKNYKPLSPLIKLALEDEPLIQPSLKILSREHVDIGIEVEDNTLKDETDNLLVIVSKLSTRPEILKQAFAALKRDGYIISREAHDFNMGNISNLNVTVLTIHKTQSEVILLLQQRSEVKLTQYIKVSSAKDFSWLPEVQTSLKRNLQDLVLYSDQMSGLLGLVNCLRREPDSAHVRCVCIMDESEAFDPNSSIYENQLKKNMAINVYNNGQWGTYRHLPLDEPKSLERQHCLLTMKNTGDLSTFTWTQGPLTKNSMEPGLILADVYYASLNFKDVMLATGKINVDLMITDRLKQTFLPGFEFSGRDQKGNRLMGSLVDGALSNLVMANPLLILPVPQSWTLREAATVPIAYGTAVYALIMMGQMKEKETILIHSGTGGTGQAAIQIALYYGCTVFTTVGTPAKRELIKKMFPQIREEHIGDSHDETFQQMIFERTNGRGVDIVLNSLSEEKLIASVRCLAKGGRFLELGKYDLASNNYVSSMLLQKDAAFLGVSLNKVFAEPTESTGELKTLLEKLLIDGAIKPLNSTVFKYTEVEQAFRFMAAGKHTGKILVEMREPEDQMVAVPKPLKIKAIARYLCDRQGVYIIVGGLGGLGLELTDWLILRGAKNILLVSRRGITTGYQNRRIGIWKSYGLDVRISTASLETKASSKQIIDEGLKMGPIAAIFNLAVVLEDAVFENQTEASFSTAFIPKSFATEFLDELSRELCPDLKDFVVFSSVSCGRGNAGQTNYGMANSVMERICEKRKRDGYPALAIEWGAVGEVGLVAEMQKGNSEVKISGTLQQRISSCLAVLDHLLTQDESTIVSSIVVAEKLAMLSADNVIDAVVNTIGMHDSKYVSPQSTLAELGMDSMTAVEVKQVLERDFEIFLSVREMRTMTLAGLKQIHESKNGTVHTTVKDAPSSVDLQIVSRLFEDESRSKIPYIPISPQVNKSEVARVIFFPGIEGFGKIFETFGSDIDNAIAVQYVLDGKTTNIKKIVESVMPTIENFVGKDQRFNMVAYSYGVLISLEVVNILESRGYHGTLICIDGAPLFTKQLVRDESEQIMQIDLMCKILAYKITPEKINKNQERISKCKTWEEKVDLGLTLLENPDADETRYMALFANTIYMRVKDLLAYTPTYKDLKSNIKLFRPTHAAIQNVVDDYGLSQFFEKPVNIQYFEGNHETILENKEVINAIHLIAQ